MVTLAVLSGSKVGTSVVADGLAGISIGRSPESDLKLTEAGVWDSHADLILGEGDTFELKARSEAWVTINDTPVLGGPLKNGDVIQIGSVKLEFSLSPVRQRGFRFREMLIWLALAALCLVELGLVYRPML